ncbi:hypothetical protein CEXT_438621 [Caerostris extrusa]|uniref:Uncharacterized protein n=1 Tax=Caerostris extrusa TaxID=172846 RepID=A0AAV4XD69_CAEEX|nr:hypothetical protein CEXT_438621 [Caerostris extrusa]
MRPFRFTSYESEVLNQPPRRCLRSKYKAERLAVNWRRFHYLYHRLHRPSASDVGGAVPLKSDSSLNSFVKAAQKITMRQTNQTKPVKRRNNFTTTFSNSARFLKL